MLLSFSSCTKEKDQVELYNAWCKLQKRNDVTYHEWTILRENYLLEGQNVEKAVNAANTAAALSGAALGAAAAKK